MSVPSPNRLDTAPQVRYSNGEAYALVPMEKWTRLQRHLKGIEALGLTDRKHRAR